MAICTIDSFFAFSFLQYSSSYGYDYDNYHYEQNKILQLRY